MWYLAPLLALDAIFPRRKLPEAAPTVERLGLEVLAALLVYDVLFFAAHLAFHKVRLSSLVSRDIWQDVTKL